MYLPVFQLDSATSLIQAAKNLMNAVVLTVKACYVASTKVKICHLFLCLVNQLNSELSIFCFTSLQTIGSD